MTLSTAEAEYVAMSAAVQEAVWLRKLLKDFGALQIQPIVIMQDNQGTICIAINPVDHSRTKHIDVRYHYIQGAICEDLVELQYCPTETMIAHLLTKTLPKGKFEMLRVKMGVEELKPQPPDELSGSVKGSN